jgi:hypothetical protein
MIFRKIIRQSKNLRALPASICLESTELLGDRSSCRSSGGPEPPGSGWQIRPRAPPSLRISGLPSGKAPSMSEAISHVTEKETNVKSQCHDTGDAVICLWFAPATARMAILTCGDFGTWKTSGISAKRCGTRPRRRSWQGASEQKAPENAYSTEMPCPARLAIFKRDCAASLARG